jgi:hypothetical protein
MHKKSEQDGMHVPKKLLHGDIIQYAMLRDFS